MFDRDKHSSLFSATVIDGDEKFSNVEGRSAPPPCDIFVRAQFDYDPMDDELIPCAQVSFSDIFYERNW